MPLPDAQGSERRRQLLKVHVDRANHTRSPVSESLDRLIVDEAQSDRTQVVYRPSQGGQTVDLNFLERISAASGLSAADSLAIDSIAGMLDAKRGSRPLAGKHVAFLLREDALQSPTEVAARSLGAEVARLPIELRHELERDDSAANLRKVLERLYEAMICDEMSLGDAAHLARLINLPVIGSACAPDHPLRRLESLLPAPRSAMVLHAFLVRAIN